jgi:hypothetical protein
MERQPSREDRQPEGGQPDRNTDGTAISLSTPTAVRPAMSTASTAPTPPGVGAVCASAEPVRCPATPRSHSPSLPWSHLWFPAAGGGRLATVVGLSRIYFGAHLPLNVIGGAGLGLVCGVVACTAGGVVPTRRR